MIPQLVCAYKGHRRTVVEYGRKEEDGQCWYCPVCLRDVRENEILGGGRVLIDADDSHVLTVNL